MERNKYTVDLPYPESGIMPYIMRVHLTWGQEWREYVTKITDTGSGVSVEFDTVATLDESSFVATWGEDYEGWREVKLDAVQLDKYTED